MSVFKESSGCTSVVVSGSFSLIWLRHSGINTRIPISLDGSALIGGLGWRLYLVVNMSVELLLCCLYNLSMTITLFLLLYTNGEHFPNELRDCQSLPRHADTAE